VKLIVAVLAFLTAFPTICECQMANGLKGLSSATIVVDTSNNRVNGEAWDDELLINLRRDVPKLKLPKDGTAEIHILADLLPSQTTGGTTIGTIANVQLQVYRPVTIVGTGESGMAVTWQRSILLSAGDRDQLVSLVRKAIDDSARTLAVDYYRQNPD
jgi:hypothetical protein